MAITLILTSIFYTALIFRDANELGIYAAGKRTVEGSSGGYLWVSGGSVGSYSNVIPVALGVACLIGAQANVVGVGGFTLTLPSDWAAYSESSNAGDLNTYWYVIPANNAQSGIYKLKNAYNTTTEYRYVQVGTSTTLVWDADTATP